MMLALSCYKRKRERERVKNEKSEKRAKKEKKKMIYKEKNDGEGALRRALLFRPLLLAPRPMVYAHYLCGLALLLA